MKTPSALSEGVRSVRWRRQRRAASGRAVPRRGLLLAVRQDRLDSEHAGTLRHDAYARQIRGRPLVEIHSWSPAMPLVASLGTGRNPWSAVAAAGGGAQVGRPPPTRPTSANSAPPRNMQPTASPRQANSFARAVLGNGYLGQHLARQSGAGGVVGHDRVGDAGAEAERLDRRGEVGVDRVEDEVASRGRRRSGRRRARSTRGRATRASGRPGPSAPCRR